MESKLKVSDQELTVLVNSCDQYEDVMSLFACSVKKFWNNCPYNIFVNTESKKYENYGFKASNFTCHDKKAVTWGSRLIDALNQIDSEYIMMLFDDFLLEAPVQNERIQKIVSYLRDNSNVSVFYLINTSLPIKENKSEFLGFSEVLDKCDYRLNSAPAIWRKSHLIDFVGKNDNPWAWEVFGSYRTFDSTNRFFTISAGEHDIYKYDYKQGGAIYRGKWVRSVVETKIKEFKLPIDVTIRGWASESELEKRTLRWKLEFLYLGYRMIGSKVFNFILKNARDKLNGR